MLREHPIHATIPATDLECARAFYADKLAAIGSPRGKSGLQAASSPSRARWRRPRGAPVTHKNL